MQAYPRLLPQILPCTHLQMPLVPCQVQQSQGQTATSIAPASVGPGLFAWRPVGLASKKYVHIKKNDNVGKRICIHTIHVVFAINFSGMHDCLPYSTILKKIQRSSTQGKNEFFIIRKCRWAYRI